jgi:hypothetical protein
MYPETEYDPNLLAQSPLTRTNIVIAVILVILVIAAPIVKKAQDRSYTQLPAASQLAGVTSQSLGATDTATLPIEGKDFTITTQSFENDQWIVGQIKPLTGEFDGGTIIFEKQQGVYQPVIGPTSAISDTQLQGLPQVVADDARAHVAIYQPVPDQN